MNTQVKHHNYALGEALLAARVKKMKEEAEYALNDFSISELKNLCIARRINLNNGDHRKRKTFVDAIITSGTKVNTKAPVLSIVQPTVQPTKNKKYTSHKKTEDKRCGFNYPANLVEKGKAGKYHLYFNKKSGMTMELVVTNNGEKRIHILTATGILRHLVENDFHKRWVIPYSAIEGEWFNTPKWMKRKQELWIISAMKAIIDLHKVFIARTSN